MNKKAIQSANLHASTAHAQAKADAVDGKVEPAVIPPWPWVVHEERFVAAADGSPVVNMCHSNKAVAKKIAPLLAAAPELLHSIKPEFLSAWASHIERFAPGIAADMREMAEEQRVAVLKAKGSL